MSAGLAELGGSAKKQAERQSLVYAYLLWTFICVAFATEGSCAVPLGPITGLDWVN